MINYNLRFELMKTLLYNIYIINKSTADTDEVLFQTVGTYSIFSCEFVLFVT